MLRRIPIEMLFAVAVSLGLHAVWLLGEAKASGKDAKKDQLIEADVEELKPPEPPKEEKAADVPEPQDPKAEEKTAPAAKAAAPNAEPMAKAAPVAAQAGQTLTAPETADESAVADFTMVQGAGNAYAGGTTSAAGTATAAVRGPVAAPAGTGTGKGGAAPAQALPVGPDRSRGATPLSTAWDCSHLFPSDSDAANFAVVTIIVTVRVDGTPKSVSILSDPGHGFGSAARSCALGQRYQAALDRNGEPTVATTPPITVRFQR
jgi:protein TonB